MNIVFCGGGTVGHITPAISIAKEFKKRHRDCNVSFIGRVNGPENEVIRKNGYPLYEIQISGLIRKLTLKNLKVIKDVFTAEKECKKILKELSADTVIGTGGYVCFPVISAAAKLGIFTAIHESNAAWGLSSKMLSKKCDVIFLGAKAKLKRKNSIYSGNPVSEEFYKTSKSEARRLLGISQNKFLIVSVGGSIGAWALNDACIEMMNNFSSKRNDVIHYHSCGKRYFESIKEAHRNLFSKNTECAILPYIEKMPLYLSAADLVISRCGAMTLSEIAASKSPSILIPSPNVTADHQNKNALYFVENGAALLINESELSAKTLIDTTLRLMNDGNMLRQMSENAYRLCSPNSAKIIVKTVEKHIFDTNKSF